MTPPASADALRHRPTRPLLKWLLTGGSGFALVWTSMAHAQSSTTTYRYDALGRLVETTTSGGPTNGEVTATTFDSAGNRTNQTVSGVANAASTLAVADASANEGSPLIFTVSRGGSASSAITVNYATSNGTAVGGTDYTATSGTLSFASGQSSKSVSVTTVDDAVTEGNETVLLTLSAPTGGATISDGQAAGTIAASDAATVSLAISNANAVVEGGALSFTVTKTGSTASVVTINYATADGAASAGSDYTSASGTLTFAPTDTSKTINVVTIDDAAHEGNEGLLVNLTSASGAAISDAQGLGMINDNDNAPGNQTPVAVDDQKTISFSSTTISVIANDSDPNGDPLTVISVSGTYFSAGVANIVRFQQPGLKIPGTYVGSYTISDGNGGTATANVTVIVN